MYCTSPLGGDTRQPTYVHPNPKVHKRGHHGLGSLRDLPLTPQDLPFMDKRESSYLLHGCA